MKQHAARGHTRKHAKATTKHTRHHAKHHPVHHHKAGTAHGHNVHAKAKHATHAKARGLALDGIACCGTEALAMSLRLQGLPVTEADVLGLHRLAGADDAAGAPLAVLLEAAAEFRLAGRRPAWEELDGASYGWAPAGELGYTTGLRGSHHPADHLGHPGALILGVDLPGSHTVLATPDGWWSWGELRCPCEFPDAVIEEAWAIAWAVAA